MHSEVIISNNSVRLSIWDGDTLRVILDISTIEYMRTLDPDPLSRGINDRDPPQRRVDVLVFDLPEVQSLQRWLCRQIDDSEQPNQLGLFDFDWSSEANTRARANPSYNPDQDA